MATSTIRVVCGCGKEYRVSDDPRGRLSIRCHVCGQIVDVPFRKAAIVEAQVKREAEVKRRRLTRAERMNYAGLQFDGVYRTSSPIVLDSDFGESLSLKLDFKRDSTLDYECRLEDSEVEEDRGTTEYEVLGESEIGFSFDAGEWETEWEGTSIAEQLRLSFRMESFFKSIVEGEAMLVFTPSANST